MSFDAECKRFLMMSNSVKLENLRWKEQEGAGLEEFEGVLRRIVDAKEGLSIDVTDIDNDVKKFCLSAWSEPKHSILLHARPNKEVVLFWAENGPQSEFSGVSKSHHQISYLDGVEEDAVRLALAQIFSSIRG